MKNFGNSEMLLPSPLIFWKHCRRSCFPHISPYFPLFYLTKSDDQMDLGNMPYPKRINYVPQRNSYILKFSFFLYFQHVRYFFFQIILKYYSFESVFYQFPSAQRKQVNISFYLTFIITPYPFTILYFSFRYSILRFPILIRSALHASLTLS